MKVSVILVGAGLGLRMGGAIKKPFLQIHGKPIFLHTIERFAQNDKIGEIILVVGKTETKSLRDTWQSTLDTYGIKKVIPGIVRPLVRNEHINAVIDKVKETGAAILAAPMKATVKEAGDKFRIQRTIPRNTLWMAQTPQGFESKLILKVFSQFKNSDIEFTYDAQMVEKAGYPVYIVPGTDENIKITTPEDVRLAEAILGQ